MGWASGSELASDIFYAVLPHVASSQKENVIREVIELFEDHDCDTLCELSDHDDETVRQFIADWYDDPDADY